MTPWGARAVQVAASQMTSLSSLGDTAASRPSPPNPAPRGEEMDMSAGRGRPDNGGQPCRHLTTGLALRGRAPAGPVPETRLQPSRPLLLCRLKEDEQPSARGATRSGWDGVRVLGAGSGRRARGTDPDRTSTGSVGSSTGPRLRSSAGSRPLARTPRPAL